MVMWMFIIGSVKWYEVPSLKSYMQGWLAIRNNYFKGSHKPYNCLILLFYPLGRSKQFPLCLIISFCFKIILQANVCPPKVSSFHLSFNDSNYCGWTRAKIALYEIWNRVGKRGIFSCERAPTRVEASKFFSVWICVSAEKTLICYANLSQDITGIYEKALN